MKRLLVSACLLVLAACSGPNLPGSPGPASAQSVAASSSDFSALKKCPESGSYDSYLKAEQTANPTQYQTAKSTWDGMKTSGANDAYVAVYAEDTKQCGQFGQSTTAGKVAYVFAFRFKDSSSASTAYKKQEGGFQLSDAQVSALKAAGGQVQQGPASGLGDNSIVISINELGVTLFVAVWQNKEFEAAMLTSNLPAADGSAVATKVNGRIH